MWLVKSWNQKQVQQFKKEKYILISEQILSPEQNTGKPNLHRYVNNTNVYWALL